MAVVWIAVVSFGVSLLTLFSGFGLGTLLLPAFAWFLSPELAVASTAVVHAANNLFKVGLLAGQVRWGVVLRFGLPAVAAAFAGAALLAALSEQPEIASWRFAGRTAHVTPLRLGLGLLIVVFALFELVPALRAWRPAARWLPLGGAVSGFFGGLSGHQGALRAVFLAPLELPAGAYAATQAVLGLAVDVARLSIYGASFVWAARGEGEALPWTLVAVATGSAFAGALLGSRLLEKVTIDHLHRLIGALLVLTGVALATGIA